MQKESTVPGADCATPAPDSRAGVRLRRQPEVSASGISVGQNAGMHAGPPAESAAPAPELFREVFGRFATGVAVITSAGPTSSGGMTANALCSLSLEPLLALVCFENRARTLPIVREAGRFAVNLLATSQEQLAGVFASKLPESEKLDGVPHELRDGVPVLDGVLAWAVCELQELIAGGDHTIAIGRVRSLGLADSGGVEPLLWYAGAYRALAARDGA
jgi:flavin reductase (DIM6/NTAB) family NADH-FMN oxidoreductase RutF